MRPYNRVVMEFTDPQTILTVLVILTAAAIAVFVDCRKKQRRQQPELAKIGDAARPRSSANLFDAAPLEYASAKKLAAQRPLEPRVATATIAKPPTAPPAIERETVTIQMTGPQGQMNSQSELSLPAFTIDAALWERLVANTPKRSLLESGESGQSDNDESNPEPALRKPALAVAPGALDVTYHEIRSESQPAWPTGMIQQPAFTKLLDGGEPFSGLVVSIGVNESDSSMWHSLGLMQSVGSYIAGLLHEKDFSCRTAYDEFIVACCGEHGAQSQRRLNHISERLWDYQLRGIGTCSILFSWGGVEVQDQPLAEAVASAVERMRQTKRAGSPSGTAGAHRKAV